MFSVEVPAPMLKYSVRLSVFPNESENRNCPSKKKEAPGTPPFSMGVPLITNPLNERPAGNKLSSFCTVYGPVPPITRRILEYGTPRVPGGRESAPHTNKPETTSEKFCEDVAPVASVNVNCM